nr:hypothetical protein [Tanacetum cinerariifolium]
NNEEVTLTMAQTLTKMKVEKQRILDEQMANGYMMKKLSKMLLEKGKNKYQVDEKERIKVTTVSHIITVVSYNLLLFGLMKDAVYLMLLDANEDVTLVDVDTAVGMDVDTQGRMKEDVTTEPEPKVFNNEEVTLTMAQTLTKMKVEKQRILDEQMAKGYMMKKLSKMLLEKGKNKVISKELKNYNSSMIKSNNLLECCCRADAREAS